MHLENKLKRITDILESAEVPTSVIEFFEDRLFEMSKDDETENPTVKLDADEMEGVISIYIHGFIESMEAFEILSNEQVLKIDEILTEETPEEGDEDFVDDDDIEDDYGEYDDDDEE